MIDADPCETCERECDGWETEHCMFYCQYIHGCEMNCAECEVADE